MTYQVLARKWRPRSFDTLVGQEHVVRALGHALDTGRLHHAYLFTGTRGVGKTTIARILAKALNCETGVSAKPCGACSSSVEIDGGRFVDYIELDAASNRGVEDMTSLLEKATYAPTRGRYKVYVIDEVHMLSGHAFNAMLKTLEEPPAHVKFILATTDPQKIPVTVLSRCLQFNLKQMATAHIASHLARVVAAEGVGFEAAALQHLAKAAAGSMRDGLSLLDQAIAHAAGDVAALMRVAAGMDERSLSFDAALQELATLFHRVALLQFAPEALGDGTERARLAPYAERFDAEYLQLCYQIAVQGREQLSLAPDEYAGFSMTLLRLFAFRPVTPPPLGVAAPAAVAPLTAPPPRAATAAAAPVAEPPPPVPAAVPPPQDWHGVVARLAISGLVRQLAQHCELATVTDTAITLRLPPAHKHLGGGAQQDKLQAELQAYYGRPLRLNIVVGAAESETPAERNRGAQRERQERAIAAIEQDGLVREIVDLFDATIDESSIKPL